MARKPRVEFPGAVYHVTARGNAKADIFAGDEDREDFLGILGDVVERCNWVVSAYCLMDNHFHILVETPEANLGKGMQLLSGTYTGRFNRKHKRAGHVFQGRYKAILVDKESYFLTVLRYVVNNPVKAGIVDNASEYRWSSHLATGGMAPRPEWLSVGLVLDRFHGETLKATRAYLKYVDETDSASPLDDVKWGMALGGDAFLNTLKPLLRESMERDASSRVLADRPGLRELFAECKSISDRDLAMCVAHDRWGYTLEEIGDSLGLHFTSVSRAMKRARQMDGGNAKNKGLTPVEGAKSKGLTPKEEVAPVEEPDVIDLVHL